MKQYKFLLNGNPIELNDLTSILDSEDNKEQMGELLFNGKVEIECLTGDNTCDLVEIIDFKPKNIEGNINDFVNEVHNNAVEHGWWEGEGRTIGELIALMHSELSEALEEHRKEDTLKKQGIDANHYTYGGKPEGIAIELIDCVIRIMDLFGRKGWDFESLLKEKHEYNKTRPYKHGNKKI